jgi:hypothetical protein
MIVGTDLVTVVTADVIRSRDARDIVAALPAKLASVAHPLLVTPFSVSRGDELQAVCRGPLQAPEIVRQLRYACLPLRLRIGIGVGEIEPNPGGPGPDINEHASGSVHTNAPGHRQGVSPSGLTDASGVPDPGARVHAPALSSWEMNGSAFRRAREALESLGKGTAPRTAVRSGDPCFDEAVGALLALMDAIQGRWTPAQWDAIHHYERLGTYGAAGKALGIALQNVQKRCKAASWSAVSQAEQALRRLAELWWGDASPLRG